MKSAKTPTLPSNAESSPVANANSVASKLKGLVQSAKNKWSAGSKAEADVVAKISGVTGGQELDRLAADAASMATTSVTPAAVEAIPSVAANIETPVYDQLAGTLQGLVSPSDFSALVTDAPVSSVSSVSSSGLSTFANPMDLGPADLVLGQAPASGAGSAAGGAGSAAGAGGAASGAASGAAASTAAGAGAATAGATAAGAGAVAAGAGVALSGGALLAGVVGVAAIGAASTKSSETANANANANANAGTATSLIVADGYLDGSNVYIDMNDNGEVDSADVLFGTSVNGTVNGFLTDAQKVHGLITSGGTDISTGLAFEGSYAATAGSLVVNPLTTLVQNMVLTTAGAQGSMSAADYLAKVKEAKASAITSVNSALGLATDADVTQIDTVSNSQSTAATTSAGITREQAIEMNSKAMMVANMMTLGAAAMKGSVADGTGTAPSMSKLSNFMVQGIVSSINTAAASGGSVALGNSDSLKTILSTATDKAKTDSTLAFDDTKLTTAATTAATTVASTNSLIDTITGNAKAASATSTGASGSLTQILQAQKAALNQAADFKTGDSTKLTAISTNFADASTAFTQALSQTGLKLGTTAVTSDKLTTERPTDQTKPEVSSITATPARAGDIAKFEVKMSEGVIVKFASDAYKPTLAIKTGNTTTGTAVFDPGLSTGDKLVFTYQVKTTDTLLSIANGTSIVLPTNTADATKPTIIKDLAGNDATLSLATALTGFTAPTVDGNAPDIKVTVADAFVKAGASTTVTFEVSEKVATAAAGAFTIDDISVREAGVLKTGRVSDFKQLTAAEVTAKSLDATKVYYTAKITAGSAGAAMDVGVANGKFTDLAGNPNKPSNVAVIGIDSGSPIRQHCGGSVFLQQRQLWSYPIHHLDLQPVHGQQ